MDNVNPAAVPCPVDDIAGDQRWLSIHRARVSEGGSSRAAVVVAGDSLVMNMLMSGVWARRWAPLPARNLGVGGDQTQHLLWRLSSGELDGLSPKVVVVQIGTNNHGHTAAQVAGGILAVCRTITERLPAAEVLVMPLLPRGEGPNRVRDKLTEVNATVERLLAEQWGASGARVRMAPSANLLAADGILPRSLSPDFLHLSEEGYEVAFGPVLKEVQRILARA